MADTAPPGLDEFLSSGGATPAPMPVAQQQPSGAAPAPPGLDEFISQEQYGTPGQQAIAGIEGAARGLTLGTSDLAETKLGLSSPEAIKGRQQANPVTSFAGNVAGGAGLIGLTGGLAAPIEAGLGGGLAASALGFGAEGAAFGAGNAISDAALGDPNLNAQKVLSDIGIGAALGVGAGLVGKGVGSILNKSGLVKGSVAETIESAENEATSKANTANAIADLKGLKPNSQEIIDAAQRIGAPVMEGQVTASPWKQKAEDMLLNGAPSYKAIAREKLYSQGIDAAKNAINSTLPADALTKNQLGQALQDSLSTKIEEDAKPFSDLYSAIKEDTQFIPLKEGSAPAIARNIQEFISDPSIGKNSPAAKLAAEVADEVGDLKTVDDLRGYQSGLSGRISPTASPAEKRIISVVREKLDDWERRAIKGYAGDLTSKVDMTNPEEAQIWGPKVERLNSLLGRIDEADAQYAPFRKNLSELSEWLGKGKVHGPKDAVQFISERLEPEDLVNKLTQKKYAGLYDFMQKNFPEESALVREYQKATLKEAASKTGEFSPKVFFNKVNELEPEIKSSIFFPDELQKINDAETYIRSIPKNFNPSGTSGASAFRAFFESPTGAAIGNTRDFLIDAFLNYTSQLPEGVRPNATETGLELAQKFKKFQAAQATAEKALEKIQDGSQAIFTGNNIRGGLTSALVNAATSGYDQKVQRVSALASNPDMMTAHLEGHTNGIYQQLPSFSQGIHNTLSSAVSFLNSKIPKPVNPKPLSSEWKPSDAQKSQFNKYYQAVDDPVSVLKSVKNGSLSSQQMEALEAVHPQLLHEMQNNVRQQLVMNKEKAKKLSYNARISIAKFLGEPMDEHMTQQSVASNQMAFQAQQQQQAATNRPKKSTASGLAKLKISNRAATESQHLQEDEM